MKTGHITSVVCVFISALAVNLNVNAESCGFKIHDTGQGGAIRVSSLGNNAEDATQIVQRALDSGRRRIVVDRAGSPYVVRPLFVRSNTELIFEEGVELIAKRNEFKDVRDALVTLHAVTNVVLRGLGKGATLRMRIEDYHSASYKRSEWRHAVNILSSENIKVENLTLADSGGDGVYIGAKPSLVPCRDIAIVDCVCDNNNRQGISVISVDGLLVERTVMKNTRGTAPRSGIDFEPNSAGQLLKRIVMRDCLTENNYGCGYELFMNFPDGRTEPIDITLENCRSVGDRYAAVKIACSPFGREKRGYPKGGAFRAKNCTFANAGSAAVLVCNKPRGSVDILLENCTIDHGGSKSEHDVRFETDDRYQPPTDGAEMRNVTIIRPEKGEWFTATQMPWSEKGMDGVCGSVDIVSGVVKRKVVLDEAWRARVFKRGGEKYVLDKVRFDPAAVTRIVDSRPGETVELSPLTVRFALDALVYAAKPGPITFSSRFVKVVAPKKMQFLVRDMNGKVIAELPGPTAKAQAHTFTAPAAGFYRLQCNLFRSGIRLVSADAPIGIMPVPRFGLDVYMSRGNLFFAHAAGSDETFFCGGTGEAVNIGLFDPAGNRADEWRNQRMWGFKRIGPDAAEGLWRIAVSPPDAPNRWEDSCYDRTGAAPVFFLTKEKYWISTASCKKGENK